MVKVGQSCWDGRSAREISLKGHRSWGRQSCLRTRFQRAHPPVGRTGLSTPSFPGVTYMSTLRQIEANRRNAQKSTGPTSATGKAASSMNALKTGIYAKSLVLPSEKLADLEQLIDDYYRLHQPDSPEARLYLDEVIHCEWLLRRYRAAETQMWQYQAQSAYADEQKYPLGKSATSHSTPFSKLQYRVDATRRAYHRSLKALKELQAEANAAPAPLPAPEPLDLPSLNHSPQTTSPQIGFVPATQSATPPEASPTPLSCAGLTPRRDLTGQGIIMVDGVLQPVPAGARSFESFPVDR